MVIVERGCGILIIDKTGLIKRLVVKEFDTNTLYKKCGFKKPDNFGIQTSWSVSIDSKKYIVQLYAKLEGRSNSVNKYDFPPPIDTTLLYGSCALVAQSDLCVSVDLNESLWNRIYEKLFGGFEDLSASVKEDELEEDELINIPSHLKTTHGYLKDGFVVDDCDTNKEDEEEEEDEDVEVEEDEDEEEDEEEDDDEDNELTEDSYDYSE